MITRGAPRSSSRHLATCAGEGGEALVGEMRGGGGNGRVSLPRRGCLQDEGNLSQETSTTITQTKLLHGDSGPSQHPTQCYMQPPSAAPGLAGWRETVIQPTCAPSPAQPGQARAHHTNWLINSVLVTAQHSPAQPSQPSPAQPSPAQPSSGSGGVVALRYIAQRWAWPAHGTQRST